MHSIKLTRYKIPHTVSFSQKFGKLAQDVLKNPVTYQHTLPQGMLLSAKQGHRFDHIYSIIPDFLFLWALSFLKPCPVARNPEGPHPM